MIKNKNAVILLALVILGLIFSCSSPSNQSVKSQNNGNSDLVEVTPFIVNRVMITDTMQLKNFSGGSTASDYLEVRGQRFLTQEGLNSFREQIYNTLNNPNSLVYHSAFDKQPLTIKEKRQRYMTCDSIVQSNIDAKGKEINLAIFACDSSSFFYMLNAIDFYESWYYNKRTSEIVKIQLGYSIYQWMEDKEAFREWYVFFVSEEARKKAIKHL